MLIMVGRIIMDLLIVILNQKLILKNLVLLQIGEELLDGLNLILV